MSRGRRRHGPRPAAAGPAPFGHPYAAGHGTLALMARRRPSETGAPAGRTPAGRRPPRQLTCAYAQLTSPRGPAASLPPRPSIWLIPPPHALLYGLAPGERLPVAPRRTGAEPDIRTPQLRCDQTELRRRTPTVSAQCRSLPRGVAAGPPDHAGSAPTHQQVTLRRTARPPPAGRLAGYALPHPHSTAAHDPSGEPPTGGRGSADPLRPALRQPSESGQEPPCPHRVPPPRSGYKGQNPAKRHKPR